VIRELSIDPEFSRVRVFVGDYDDKATLRELRVTERSTLASFKGTEERARSGFETNRAKIRDVFTSAVK
jgi:hypothetical protein